MTTIKPMLASKADWKKIKYPVLATPKLDGIRCLCVDGVPMSRNMKPIPNDFVREQLKGLHGLDGELMVRGDFNDVQSGIMRKSGEPDFEYHVFDLFDCDGDYKLRMETMEWDLGLPVNSRIKSVLPVTVHTEDDLQYLLDTLLDAGYEGVMIRQPSGPYKQGRSTVNEGYLLKIKKFLSDEARLVCFNEKMTNNNAKEKDELGRSKRSSHKENLVPAGTAGSATVNWNGHEFNVGFGPGIDDKLKKVFWSCRSELVGDILTFSYQELSKDGVPRFGKMLGFRHENDM